MKTLLLFLSLAPLTVFGQWNQVGQDVNGDNIDDNFGVSVGINADGTVIAAGALFNDGGVNNGGHVKIYQQNGSSWVQRGQALEGNSPEEFSGSKVELNHVGDIVAIGSQNYLSGNGRVRVYKYNGNSWSQMGQTINSEAVGDAAGFTASLSADGTILAVGARNNDGNGFNAGHTRIFEFNGSNWIQMGQDIDGENADENSGYAVDLSADGQTVAIGAPLSDSVGNNTGHARVFQFDGSNWIQLGQNIIGEAAEDFSGVEVQLNASGDILAVGAAGNDGNGSISGHVRVYQFNAVSWNQIGDDIDGANAGDFSGAWARLSATGLSIVIGSQFSDGNGADSGEMRVFDFNGSSWAQRGQSIFGASTDDKLSPVNMSADGSRIIGGMFQNNANGDDSGKIRVYEFGNPPSNNNPTGAFNLQIGNSFNQFDVTGTNEDATASETIATFLDSPSCGNYIGGDVWYGLVIPASGRVTIETRGISGSNLQDTVISVYDSNGNEIVCNDDETPNSNLFSLIELTNQTQGDEIFIRVWAYNNAQQGSFRISAYDTTLGIEDKNNVSFTYYPNPVQDIINFKVSAEIKQIEIYNLLGQKVISQEINNTTAQVNLSHLANGAYVARIQTTEGEQTVKLIKQ